jgi:ABC-type multidrug transport system fused ATPase/permease subunit
MSAESPSSGSATPETVSFGRLFGLARGHLGPLVLATLLLLAASSIGLWIPRLAGGVVDTALERASLTDLRRVVVGLIGLFALLGLVGYFESYLLGATGARLLLELRSKLFDRLIGLTPGFFDQRRVGELLSRLGSDLTLVQGALTHQIPAGLQALVRLIGTLGILFFLEMRLTLLALAVVPPVVLVAVYFGGRLQRVSTRARDATAETAALAEESLAGIRTVQAHGAQPRMQSRFAAALWDLLRVQLRHSRLSAAFSGVVTFASFSAFGLVLGYGGQLMLEQRLTAGELTSFLLYTFSVAVSVGQLGGLYAGYRELRGASVRLFELLDTEPLVADPARSTPPAQPFAMGAGELSIEDLGFRYPGTAKPALDGLSLHVPGGSVVALVGPSGSGKSTLFALLLRFYAADSGRIAIDGRDIASIGLADLRRSIATVPQEVFLFSGTIADNLRLAVPEASLERLEAAAAAAGALGFIRAMELGFETQIGERGIRLSAGQRQRLAIARAFLANPRLLLLDEATSSLDADSEAVVQEALERLFVGRTTVVIAHRLATARRADRIHVLEGGRIAASGNHAELYASSELYRRYWSLQSLAGESPQGNEFKSLDADPPAPVR